MHNTVTPKPGTLLQISVTRQQTLIACRATKNSILVYNNTLDANRWNHSLCCKHAAISRRNRTTQRPDDLQPLKPELQDTNVGHLSRRSRNPTCETSTRQKERLVSFCKQIKTPLVQFVAKAEPIASPKCPKLPGLQLLLLLRSNVRTRGKAQCLEKLCLTAVSNCGSVLPCS